MTLGHHSNKFIKVDLSITVYVNLLDSRVYGLFINQILTFITQYKFTDIPRVYFTLGFSIEEVKGLFKVVSSEI